MGETLRVRRPCVHEHRQGFPGLQGDVLPLLTGCGQVEAARIQSFLDAVRVRSRGDDDTATIGLEAAADELGHRVEKERVLFIELGEVPWLVHLVHLGRWRELRRFDAWVFFGTHLRNSLSNNAYRNSGPSARLMLGRFAA